MREAGNVRTLDVVSDADHRKADALKMIEMLREIVEREGCLNIAAVIHTRDGQLVTRHSYDDLERLIGALAVLSASILETSRNDDGV